MIVFWLVWWAWTQWTWSLNEADTEHVRVRSVTLVATASAFVMALAVPLLFEDEGAWGFAISYLVVRVLGIGLQWRLAEGDGAWVRAVRAWTIMSSLGLLAMCALPFVPPEARLGLLSVAALLDVLAAVRAGSGEWRLFPGHFAERHGLFVIIALGESLIVAGAAATDQVYSLDLLVVVVTAVAATCALWWSYFTAAHPAIEAAMVASEPREVGRFARDVFSFGHFPIIAGIIVFAAGVEEIVAHPADPVEWPAALAAVLGGALFITGTGLALREAGVRAGPRRWVAGAFLAAALPGLVRTPGWVLLLLVATVVVVVAMSEPLPSD